jgi:hypothetical protein
MILSAFHYYATYSPYNTSRSAHAPDLLFAIALLYTGGKEIRSHHLQRSRALPWLMGIVAVCIVLAVVVVVRERGDYPASARASFLGSCQSSGGSPAWCGCALSWFESHKSLSETIAIGLEIRAGGAMPADVTAGLASSCPR